MTIAAREALLGLGDHAIGEIGDELVISELPRERRELGERLAKHRAPAWGLVAKAAPGSVFPREQAKHLDVLDLLDLISNFSAYRVSGGLNLLANLIGKPGKTDMDGSKVQDLFDAGGAAEINRYCRCDVLDTYFVFLRTRVLLGKLPLEAEQELVAQTKTWLEEHAGQQPAFRHYLDHWGDWIAPAD